MGRAELHFADAAHESEVVVMTVELYQQQWAYFATEQRLFYALFSFFSFCLLSHHRTYNPYMSMGGTRTWQLNGIQTYLPCVATKLLLSRVMELA